MNNRVVVLGVSVIRIKEIINTPSEVPLAWASNQTFYVYDSDVSTPSCQPWLLVSYVDEQGISGIAIVNDQESVSVIHIPRGLFWAAFYPSKQSQPIIMKAPLIPTPSIDDLRGQIKSDRILKLIGRE